MSQFYDFFISHSHKDEVAVRQLVDRMKDWDLDVYVDFEDPLLSEAVDRALASRLREKLALCRALLLTVSENTASSRWIPWELGFADGAVGRAYIFPLTDKALETVSQQEYFHLYDSINRDDPRAHLKKIAAQARESSVSPAHIAAMVNMGQLTADNLAQFRNPAIASEFLTNGPRKLANGWTEGLFNNAFEELLRKFNEQKDK